MSSNKKKRVTVRYLSPNPLFEEWLTKWRDDAIEKGSKMQYCFKTALQSLKRYPLPLENAKDCKILKGFGDKLCMMLDEKLKESKRAETEDNDAMLIAVSSGASANSSEFPKNTKINNKKTKPPGGKPTEAYIPKHGSGGYAILISLLVKSQETNFKGYTLKAEIIEQARSLSTKSFTRPNPGSFYTAWSSMQTLISKGFVVKWSNPAKFKLTDQGLALALSLQEKGDPNQENYNDCLPNMNSANGSGSSVALDFNVRSCDDSNGDKLHTNKEVFESYTNKEVFEIIDDYDPMDFQFPIAGTSYGNKLENLSDARTSEPNISPLIPKEKFEEHLNGHKNEDPLDEDFLDIIAKYSSQEEIAAQETLLNRYSLESEKTNIENKSKSTMDEEFSKIAAKYTKNDSKSSSTVSSKYSVTTDYDLASNSEFQTDLNSDKNWNKLKPNQHQIKPWDDRISKSNNLNQLVSSNKPALKRTLSESSTAKEPNQKSTKPKFSKFLSESSKDSKKSENAKGLQKCLKSHKSDVSDTSETAETECFLMGPESFDVILLVDNQENSNSKNQEIQDILKSQLIKFETRDLKVGDYAWICRCRMTQKELIMPYIVERKRMDDFGCSIKDGRYYEQKQRLIKSGIENITYLVESHGKNSSVGLPLSSLHQAATNTALQDNFFIKFTNNIKETTNYLVSFSKSLIKLYKDKTLVSCPRDELKPVDLNDDLVYLMQFKLFNKSSVKNQKMQVSDMFVKILIQIKGMSVEKAIAIAEKYPTLLSLYEAYEESVDNQREKLLSDIKYGKLGKPVGAVLSRTVYQLFTNNCY